MSIAASHKIVVIHRGAPPYLTPDPWSHGSSPRILHLARAIASSPGWEGRGTVTLVVRSEPEPVIAAIGRFDETTERWLVGVSEQLAIMLPLIVLLDHAAVESACERLADTIADRFGRREARQLRYTAVPRGGLIVLGILAYLLDVPRNRLSQDHREVCASGQDDRTPMVIVDDIAISGLRLSQFLARRVERPIVIATLHSHPELRSAFLDRHDQVTDFLSAYDLKDLGPDVLGEGYRRWAEHWWARVDPDTVWIGQTERVVYPWNEPDGGIWNPLTSRQELGWTFVPPEHCLKHRSRNALDVQFMPVSSGTWHLAPEVVYAEIDNVIVTGNLRTKGAYELSGVAADIWRSIAVTGDVELTVDRVAAEYSAPVQQVRSEVCDFVDELRIAGLLVEAA